MKEFLTGERIDQYCSILGVSGDPYCEQKNKNKK